ncbi:MAG TPA: DUF1698 domain-containing protein [Isosphaeraceae bacterium]|nr:DUF1698 domain-containing protein [Isosphaeraceae bacterium]
MATATADLKDELRRIRWFHKIDLGGGITTPGIDDTPVKLRQAGLTDDLTGKSVLDIGAWDGFFSFEAERRGAARVVALDHLVWNAPAIGKAGFEFARRALNSQVEDVDCDVHALTPAHVGGAFDLVLFLGVLYHTPHPLMVLQNVSAVTSGQLILETHVDLNEYDRPVLAFYPGNECADDPSNWFGPNRAAVEAMLGSVGFREVKVFSTQAVGYRVHGGERSQFGRMVFHAWK